MFNHVIVKQASKSIINGITTADLGKPIYEKALEQHAEYIETLKQCDVEIIVLEADETFPDSCFVEDTALLTNKCAILTRPGAKSRKGEIIAMKSVLERFYTKIETIENPGTVEAGDIMMVGNHFYIGLSDRTNKVGAEQCASILEKYGHTSTIVELKEILHLKTGLSYIENNNLLISGEFLANPIFNNFNKIIIDPDEAYAANCIWVNGTVIIPKGFPKTKAKIEALNYKVVDINVSEFEKIDGGLSCLSLRF